MNTDEICKKRTCKQDIRRASFPAQFGSACNAGYTERNKQRSAPKRALQDFLQGGRASFSVLGAGGLSDGAFVVLFYFSLD